MFVTSRYDDVIVDVAAIISKLNDAYSMSTEIKYMLKYGVKKIKIEWISQQE